MTTKTPAAMKMERLAAEGRLDHAREAAEEIVGRLRLTVPIDPLLIAVQEPALRVKHGNFRNRFDGQLEYHASKRRFLLFYNTKYDVGQPLGCHHPRTRFSIAHELGHYFLERHRAYFLRGGKPHPSRGEFDADVEMEREADAFASGILMPSKLARPLVNEDELSITRIEEIASHFQASLVSTALRAVQVSDYPCSVVGIREGAIAWAFRSQALIDARLYPPERGAIASPSTRQQWAAFQAGVGPRGQGSGVSHQWFRTYDRDDLARLHVTESYLPVPSMGTLIVLLTVPEDEIAREDDDE